MKNAVETAIDSSAKRLGLITLTPDVYSIKNRIYPLVKPVEQV